MPVPKVSILERVDCTHGGGFQNGQCVNLYGTCIKLSKTVSGLVIRLKERKILKIFGCAKINIFAYP